MFDIFYFLMYCYRDGHAPKCHQLMSIILIEISVHYNDVVTQIRTFAFSNSIMSLKKY